MKIISYGYSSSTNKTEIVVEIDRALSAVVREKVGTYTVTLDGDVAYDSEDTYERVISTLADAGVSVMPF